MYVVLKVPFGHCVTTNISSSPSVVRSKEVSTLTVRYSSSTYSHTRIYICTCVYMYVAYFHVEWPELFMLAFWGSHMPWHVPHNPQNTTVMSWNKGVLQQHTQIHVHFVCVCVCVPVVGKRLCAYTRKKAKVEWSTRIQHTNGSASFNTCWCNQVKDDVKNYLYPYYQP